jgi:hypothetical protein
MPNKPVLKEYVSYGFICNKIQKLENANNVLMLGNIFF